MTDVPTMDELWRHREKELCAEIERLTELVDMWSGRYASIKTDNDEAVVFLDRLAERLEGVAWGYDPELHPIADDCRKMAARLKGET